MEYKYKPGQRVRILDVPSLGERKGWAGREMILKRHDSDGWDGPGWSVEEHGCHYRFRESEMALVGPIRTETVQHIEPGVYGRLEVVEGYPDKSVSARLTHSNNSPPWPESYPSNLNAPEWRELARVALEIAEYLENA